MTNNRARDLYSYFIINPPTTEIYTLSLHDALPIFQHPAPMHLHQPVPQRLKRLVRRPTGAKAVRAVQKLLLVNSFEHHRRSEEHTSELQSRFDLVCRLLLEKKNDTEVFLGVWIKPH